MTSIDIENGHYGSKPQLDEGRIRKYMEMIENGEELPAPVICQHKDGGHTIVEGFHRIAALKRCGVKFISPVYFVAVPPEKIGPLRSQIKQALLEDSDE